MDMNGYDLAEQENTEISLCIHAAVWLQKNGHR